MVEEIIKKLPKYIAVTGSYARGTATFNSDFDFYLPESKWEHFKKWSKENIPSEPTSCFPFTLTWNLGDYHCEQIEFSVIFQRQKDKLPSVTLFGREFKTR